MSWKIMSFVCLLSGLMAVNGSAATISLGSSGYAGYEIPPRPFKTCTGAQTGNVHSCVAEVPSLDSYYPNPSSFLRIETTNSAALTTLKGEIRVNGYPTIAPFLDRNTAFSSYSARIVFPEGWNAVIVSVNQVCDAWASNICPASFLYLADGETPIVPSIPTDVGPRWSERYTTKVELRPGLNHRATINANIYSFGYPTVNTFEYSFAPTPEPSTILMLLAATTAALMVRLQKKTFEGDEPHSC